MPAGWTTTRARILHRDPVCRLNYGGCTGPSTDVDHIIRGGGETDSNYQGACAHCHRLKTQLEAHAARWPGQ